MKLYTRVTGFLTRNFLQGILALAPIFLTGYIFYLVFVTIDRIGRFFLGFWVDNPHAWKGIGFLIAVAAVTAAGYFSSRWFGYPLFNWLERQFLNSRITKGVYGVIHDTLAAIFGTRRQLTKVVLVDFPRLGFKRLGFMTHESIDALSDLLRDQVVVYFPHSFQVSGNMMIVPAEAVSVLDMPADKALKIIMSGGIAQQ